MSYASLTAPLLPARRVLRATAFLAQSLAAAALLWVLLAAPGFVNDKAATHRAAPIVALR